MVLVTRVFPFAGASGDEPPFARASGDNSPPPVARGATPPAPTKGAVGIRPPRPNHPRKLHFRGARYRATPPLDEELRPRRYESQQLYSAAGGGQVAAGTHQVPSVGGVFVLLGGELGLTMDVVVQQLL